MDCEINYLIEALAQYSKSDALKYEQIALTTKNSKKLEQEIVGKIKHYRWLISKNKRDAKEYERYIDRYFNEKEVVW